MWCAPGRIIRPPVPRSINTVVAFLSLDRRFAWFEPCSSTYPSHVFLARLSYAVRPVWGTRFRFSRIVRTRRRIRHANTLKHTRPFCHLCRGLRRDNERPRATVRNAEVATVIAIRARVVRWFMCSTSTLFEWSTVHPYASSLTRFVVINIRTVAAAPVSAPDGYHRPVITPSTLTTSPVIRSYTRVLLFCNYLVVDLLSDVFCIIYLFNRFFFRRSICDRASFILTLAVKILPLQNTQINCSAHCYV